MSGRCVNMMINDVDDMFQFSKSSWKNKSSSSSGKENYVFMTWHKICWNLGCDDLKIEYLKGEY